MLYVVQVGLVVGGLLALPHLKREGDLRWESHQRAEALERMGDAIIQIGYQFSQMKESMRFVSVALQGLGEAIRKGSER